MMKGILEGLGLVLELLGWASAGVRSLRADRAEAKRKEKAAQRSANRDADLLQRFTRYPVRRCACTHEMDEHGYVGASLACGLCGCVCFRESSR